MSPGGYTIRAYYPPGGSQFGSDAALIIPGNATIANDSEITPPAIAILSPQNQTYDGRLVPLNFTVYDYSPISWMGYSLDGQANTTVTDNVTLNVGAGSHNVVVYANDTYGNMGSSDVVNFSSLGGCVVIRVQYLDGCRRSEALVLAENSTGWYSLPVTNESGLSTRCGKLSPGIYQVSAFWPDSGTRFGPPMPLLMNENGDGICTIEANYEITPPAIEIISPQNLTYYNSSVPLNLAVYDYSPVSWIGYSLDSGANLTVYGNTTLTLADGPHQVVVYANDTFGNMGSSSMASFTVDTTLHDLAVTNVTVSNNSVRQGDPVTVNVTVENHGDNSETFNVTVYANATVVSTLRNIVLSARASTTVNITWNTWFLAGGNYTVSAYAWPVPGETNTANNTFTDGTLQVTPYTPPPIASGGTRKYVC